MHICWGGLKMGRPNCVLCYWTLNLAKQNSKKEKKIEQAFWIHGYGLYSQVIAVMDLYLFFQGLQSCENRMPRPMPMRASACPVACFLWAAGRVSSVTSPPLPDRHQPAGVATENLQVPKFARRKTNPPPPILLLCWVAPVRDRATVLP